MMRVMSVAAIALLLSFGVAAADVDVEIGVDPTVATYGDQVSVFACVENLGMDPEMAAVDVLITFDGIEMFSASGCLPLPAGEELCGEAVFIVVPAFEPGIYEATVTVTVSDGSDTDTATLEIVGSSEGLGGGSDIVGDSFMGAFGLSTAGPDVSDPDQWGSIKELFR